MGLEVSDFVTYYMMHIRVYRRRVFLLELCKCCGMEFGWVVWLGIVVRGERGVVGVIGVGGFGFCHILYDAHSRIKTSIIECTRNTALFAWAQHDRQRSTSTATAAGQHASCGSNGRKTKSTCGCGCKHADRSIHRRHQRLRVHPGCR